MSPNETVNAALSRGAVEEVSDDGAVTLRLPTGAHEVVQIPLEQVARVRSLLPKSRGAP
jgi:hypothetical protein